MDQQRNEQNIDWMTEQRNRLKAEIDELAPKLTVANAKIGELTAQLESVTYQLSNKTTDLGNNQAALSASQKGLAAANERADKNAATVSLAHGEIDKLRTALASKQASISRLANAVGPLFQELSKQLEN